MDTIKTFFEEEIIYEFPPNRDRVTTGSYLSHFEKPLFLISEKYSLKLFRVRDVTGNTQIHRLTSGDCFADFVRNSDGGVKVLKFQGDEDFLNKFAKVVFECGSKRIFGAASIESPQP